MSRIFNLARTTFLFGGLGILLFFISVHPALAAPPKAPVITYPKLNQKIFSFNPTITGTAENNTTITIYLDTKAVATGNTQNSSFSVRLSKRLTAGSHTLFAIASRGKDKSKPSSTITFTLAKVVFSTSGDTKTLFNAVGSDILLLDIAKSWPTADALTTNPSDCATNQFANAIDANGNLTCASIGGPYLLTAGGTIAGDLTVTGTITANLTGNLTGNASTSTSLAANGSNCPPGQYPLGIDASGNVESCTTDSGSGSSIILDLGDDGGNDSTALSELAITGDTNAIFTESSADKLLINLANKWPAANTADSLTVNPADCSSNQFANAIGANGNLTCAALVDADIPNSITITLAATATALAADGSNCSAGSGALGVDASGVAQGCTDFEEDLVNSAGLLAALDDESGTGVAIFGTSPTIATPIITGKVDRNNVAVSDDDCTGEQGVLWYDTTDSQFEFCNTGSGTPAVLPGTPEANYYVAGDNSPAMLKNTETGCMFDPPVGNNCLTFDGTDDYIRVTNHADLKPTGGITLSMWIYPFIDADQRLIVKSNNRGYNFTLNTGTAGDGLMTLALTTNNNPTNATISTTSEVPVGKWTLVTATVLETTASTTPVGTDDTTTQDDRARIYINGEMVVQMNNYNFGDGEYAACCTDARDDVHIGAWETPPGTQVIFFNGRMDDIRLYDREIDSATVASFFTGVSANGRNCVSSFTGLINCWKLDETSNTTASATVGSGYSAHDGTLNSFDTASPFLWNSGWVINNSDMYVWTGTNCKLGSRCIVLDGYDDYLSVKDAADIDPTSAWTIEGWVRLDQTGVRQTIISKYADTAAGGGGYGMYINASNQLVGEVVQNTTIQTCTGTTAMSISTFYHVAVTFNASTDTLKCYVNATAENTNSSATNTPTDSSAPLRIGISSVDVFTTLGTVPVSFPLEGRLDELAIWNTDLPASGAAIDIADRYNGDSGAALVGTETNLKWAVHFNETQGNNAANIVTQSTAGSDSNDCLSTSSPCLTIQRVLNLIPRSYGGSTTINIASGIVVEQPSMIGFNPSGDYSLTVKGYINATPNQFSNVAAYTNTAATSATANFPLNLRSLFTDSGKTFLSSDVWGGLLEITDDTGYCSGSGFTVGNWYRIEAPVAALNGEGTVSSSGTTVTGTGTKFTQIFNAGSYLYSSGQTLKVASVASDTSLTLTTTPSPALSSNTYTIDYYLSPASTNISVLTSWYDNVNAWNCSTPSSDTGYKVYRPEDMTTINGGTWWYSTADTSTLPKRYGPAGFTFTVKNSSGINFQQVRTYGGYEAGLMIDNSKVDTMYAMGSNYNGYLGVDTTKATIGEIRASDFSLNDGEHMRIYQSTTVKYLAGNILRTSPRIGGIGVYASGAVLYATGNLYFENRLSGPDMEDGGIITFVRYSRCDRNQYCVVANNYATMRYAGINVFTKSLRGWYASDAQILNGGAVADSATQYIEHTTHPIAIIGVDCSNCTSANTLNNLNNPYYVNTAQVSAAPAASPTSNTLYTYVDETTNYIGSNVLLPFNGTSPLIRVYTATYDPASLAANTSRETAVTVTGVASGDAVLSVSKPTHTTNYVVGASGRTAADTVYVQEYNNYAATTAVDPGSETWTFVVATPVTGTSTADCVLLTKQNNGTTKILYPINIDAGCP